MTTTVNTPVKLTRADNEIFDLIQSYPWPVRFSFIESQSLYTNEQLNISIQQLTKAGMIELADHHARTYQIKQKQYADT